MPWVSETYSLPAGTTVSPNTTIQSTWANTLTSDLQSGMNFTRPISRGGTGATTAVGAADNLSTISSDIASSSTTDLSNATGIHVTITGTTTITGFGTEQAGAVRVLRFGDSLTLTHNATSLILPGGTNITTSAGDVFEFTSEGSGNWRCTGYALANGRAIDSQSRESTTSKTSAYTVTTADDQATILCDATSAAFTVTLPAAATAGDGFVVAVKKTDSSANAVTIDGDGAETIDGSTTRLLAVQNESVILICDGSDWSIKAVSASGVVKIKSETVSSVSSVTIQGLLGLYRKVVIEIEGFVPVTDGATLGLLVSTDGTSFDNGAGNYRYSAIGQDSSGSTRTSSAENSTLMVLTPANGVGNGAGEHLSGSIDVMAFANSSLPTMAKLNATYVTTAGGTITSIGGGRRNANQTDVAVRLMFNSGDIASGSYTAYGYLE